VQRPYRGAPDPCMVAVDGTDSTLTATMSSEPSSLGPRRRKGAVFPWKVVSMLRAAVAGRACPVERPHHDLLTDQSRLFDV